MKAVRLAALLMVLVATSTCQGATATAGTPSPANGTAFLNRLVSLAQAHDFNGVCAAGDLNCSTELDTAGRDAVPPAVPRIIESHYTSSSGSNGTQSIGGLVFSVCGIDGRDQPYRSQVLVFPSGSSLAAINSVYWDNVSIADGATPSTPASSPSHGAGC